MTDNDSVVHVSNKQTSRDPYLLSLIRKMVLICLRNNIMYREHPICPVSLMLDYVTLRGSAPGPLFCWADGAVISRSYFTRSLKEVLQYCNLDEDRYKAHSFRIGAASWAAAKGMCDSQIRVFGR